jgi:hypothetical protein
MRTFKCIKNYVMHSGRVIFTINRTYHVRVQCGFENISDLDLMYIYDFIDNTHQNLLYEEFQHYFISIIESRREKLKNLK